MTAPPVPARLLLALAQLNEELAAVREEHRYGVTLKVTPAGLQLTITPPGGGRIVIEAGQEQAPYRRRRRSA